MKRVDEEKARKLFAAKVSNIEAAEILGCRPNTIPDIKRRLGFETHGVRKGHGLRLKVSRADREALALKYSNVPPPARSDVPREKRLTNGGGIRRAPLSRAADKDRPRDFIGSTRKAKSVVKFQRERVPQSCPNLFDSEACEPVKQIDIRENQCRWIMGAIKGADTPMCAGRVSHGSPYCPHHRERATIRKQPEVEEAA